jgi:hypothetical protein
MWKEFVFSCPVFGGFRVILNVTQSSTLKTLVSQGVAELKSVLKHHNLNHLLDLVATKHYHIHSHTLSDILTQDTTVYICDCSN